jgi:hypothetical protein
MLTTKQGSIDWAGLPFVVSLLGVQDIDTLVKQLMTIKFHKPPEQD